MLEGHSYTHSYTVEVTKYRELGNVMLLVISTQNLLGLPNNKEDLP